jgi:hypothetical protein
MLPWRGSPIARERRVVKHVIEAEGLTRRYRLGARTVTALEDVLLHIESGDYVAVTGPTQGPVTFSKKPIKIKKS